MFPSQDKLKTKYIGRKDELSLFGKLLDEVRGGKGKLVIVGGEAGIGKTRLIEEMIALPNFQDFNFLSGRCLYFKDTDIYLPFKEMFTQYKKMTREKKLEVTSPFSSLGDEALTGEEDMPLSDQEFGPMSLIPAEIEIQDEEVEEEMLVEGLLEFDKLSQFIFEMSEKGPLCLFIDDLHWADPPSIKLLQFLARKILDHQIMIVCTYRPEDLFWGEEDSHPLADPLKSMSRDKLYFPMELKRLSPAETQTLVKDVLSIQKTPDKFNKLIYKRTSGNPFFIEEILYSLLERGIITPTEPDWAENIDPDTISLPSTLRDVILRRIHWLKGNSMSVIRLASVSGPKVTFDIIRDALGMKEEDILEAIEELVQAKFLKEEKEEESYEFENPVIQEVIYTELNHSRRKFLHLKMGKVLEDRYSNNPTVWGNIAIHYYKGKDFERALFHLTKASSYYQQRSPQKSLEYLHMVLDCIERLPRSESIKLQHLDVLLEIANLCLQIGDWNRSLEFSEKARNLATVLRKPLEEGRSKIVQAEVFKYRGDFARASDLFKEAINTPHEQGSSEIIATGFMGIGYISWRTSDYPKALEMFSKSLQYAKIENNINTIGTLYLNIGNVFDQRGDCDKAMDYYMRGIKHLEKIGNLLVAARGYADIGDIQMEIGKLDEAEISLEDSMKKAKEKGRFEYWWPNINMILLKGLQGKFKESKEIFEMATDHLKQRDEKIGMGIAFLYRGISMSLEGDKDEAETMILRAIGIFESLGVPYEIGRGKKHLGEHYLKNSR